MRHILTEVEGHRDRRKIELLKSIFSCTIKRFCYVVFNSRLFNFQVFNAFSHIVLVPYTVKEARGKVSFDSQNDK
jgi:hypothetical protein